MEHEQGLIFLSFIVRYDRTRLWSIFSDVSPVLQIVSTLVANKEYTDKMLSYAESHNQVFTLQL